MQFSTDESFANQLDIDDPLRSFRDKFHLPLGKDGKPLIYFAGNSLGLMPKSAKDIVDQELDDWAKLGVDAHLEAKTPWYTYHEPLREPTARMVGAKTVEVICMNSLTVNLHLMMATFYRPTKSRFKILMEDPAFPSDTYAIKTQIRHHGLDPKDALILASPCKGEFTARTEDIVDLIEKNRDQNEGNPRLTLDLHVSEAEMLSEKRRVVDRLLDRRRRGRWGETAPREVRLRTKETRSSQMPKTI